MEEIHRSTGFTSQFFFIFWTSCYNPLLDRTRCRSRCWARHVDMGRHSGAVPPKFILCPPNFVATRKICFKHVVKQKSFPPKMFCAPPNLEETWLRACVEQPFDYLVVQNRLTVHPVRRSMDWTVKANLVDGLFFCATFTEGAISHFV